MFISNILNQLSDDQVYYLWTICNLLNISRIHPDFCDKDVWCEAITRNDLDREVKNRKLY